MLELHSAIEGSIRARRSNLKQALDYVRNENGTRYPCQCCTSEGKKTSRWNFFILFKGSAYVLQQRPLRWGLEGGITDIDYKNFCEGCLRWGAFFFL